MYARQMLQVLHAQALETAVRRMGLQRDLGEVSPVAQGLRIDAEHGATVSQGKCSHERDSFQVKQGQPTAPGQDSQGYPWDIPGNHGCQRNSRTEGMRMALRRARQS